MQTNLMTLIFAGLNMLLFLISVRQIFKRSKKFLLSLIR